jgi:lipoprotein-releasing system ATP-binding protein
VLRSTARAHLSAGTRRGAGDLDRPRRRAVALVGPSRRQVDFWHIAGLLETPDSGHVVVNGRDCAGMNDQDRTAVRRTEMGFIYQFHQLLPEFSALENVMMPQMILGRSRRQAAVRARQLLSALGLARRRSSPGRAVGRRAAAPRSPRAACARLIRRRADRQPRPAHGRASRQSLVHLIRTTG